MSTEGRSSSRSRKESAGDDSLSLNSRGASNPGLSMVVSATMGLIRTVTFLYEIVSWPIYSIFSSGQAIIDDQGPVLAQPVRQDDFGSPWRAVEALSESQLIRAMFPGTSSLDDLWKRALRLWPKQDILGARKVVKIEMEPQANGRKFKKLTLGEYRWFSYSDLETRIEGISLGFLHHLNLLPREDRVLIFAETRIEWQLIAQACFRTAVPLVTLYATLGDEALIHGVDESDVRVLVTSDELLPKVIKLLPKMPRLTHVIYMRDIQYAEEAVEGDDFVKPSNDSLPSHVSLLTVSRLEEYGRAKKKDVKPMEEIVKPTRDDLAIIMYTSGSTGQPKGVLMSHANLMCSMSGQASRLPVLTNRDRYIAYLPLAHVLELCCENVLIAHGVPVGYGSPLTLTDNSSKVKHGTKGDARQLRPTLMACVPTILDRLHKTVWEKVNEGGILRRELFQWALDFRHRRLEHGFPSLLLDRLLFRQIRSVLGGRVRLMLSGGAPLSEHAQEFINTCFCRIVQGYGLTETCGAGTLVAANNLRGAHVGAPLRCLEIKVRPWEEGGYSPNDKPNPRGEVMIGGECVAMGYYKQEEKTKEDFEIDSQGKRWFATGDIGMFYSDGTLAIVDRKKDLVKLQTGEYISLGKVELALSACPVVETVCVYGDAFESAIVAIIVPKRKALISTANQALGKDCNDEDFDQICQNPIVRQAVLKQLQNMGRDKNLERLEIPVGVWIDPNTWMPESGLVTDALKLKRRAIQSHFQKEINIMYGH